MSAQLCHARALTRTFVAGMLRNHAARGRHVAEDSSSNEEHIISFAGTWILLHGFLGSWEDLEGCYAFSECYRVDMACVKQQQAWELQFD